MPKKHTAAAGDCVSSVAGAAGIPWRTVYDHPENADLKSRRKNPNLLVPGDVISVLDAKPKKVGYATGQTHKIVVSAMAVRLKIKLLDLEGKPIASKPFELAVGAVKREGATNGEGLLDVPIPAEPKEAALKVWAQGKEKPPLAYKLALGSLQPESELKGVQARLRNLGYECGPPDGAAGAGTKEALSSYQKAASLGVTGEVNDETRKSLVQKHGL